MKRENHMKKFTDKELEDLSSLLSGEENSNHDLLNRFVAEDKTDTAKQWKELSEMNDDRELDVDKAWDKLYSRMDENGLVPNTKMIRKSVVRTVYFRIAAVVLILLGIGSVIVYLSDRGAISRKTVIATTGDQKNIEVTLPDGSTVYMNRNSKLSYARNFSVKKRVVELTGEAFFEITPDQEKSFTVNTGKANVTVMGTSFNVITDNTDSAVEVFVQTGKVMVSDLKGEKNLILNPGDIGIVNSGMSEKIHNDDPNYMAWNTGILIYDNKSLKKVFSDLKRTYNMDITVDNPGIMEHSWTTNGPLDNVPEETVIRLICGSFNLNYSKDGNTYYLMER
jgi:transmembrane sensor